MQHRSLILVVDDEPQIHRFLAPALGASGFDVLRADTGAEALRLLAGRAPDLLLLDLGLPDLDGHEVLARLRAFSQVPVIVLSARDQEREKIAALDGGADDYVEKPFGLGELLARIRSALRNRTGAEAVETTYRALGLEIDPRTQSVRLDGAAITLSRREHALLDLLVRNAGRVLTHRQLLTAVWGPAHTEDVAYLRVYVRQLRRRLDPVGSQVILTEAGIGYRLKEMPPDA